MVCVMEHLFCKLGHSPRAYKLVHEASLAYLIPCVWVPLSTACFGTLHKVCVMLWGGGERVRRFAYVCSIINQKLHNVRMYISYVCCIMFITFVRRSGVCVRILSTPCFYAT